MSNQRFVVNNERYASLASLTTYTVGDEEQFKRAIIIDDDDDDRRRCQPSSSLKSPSRNRFDNARENWAKYNASSDDDRVVYDTFRYMFYKFKKGIYCRVRNNRLVRFVPFCDARYRNEFAERIRYDTSRFQSMRQFLHHVARLSGYERCAQTPLPVDEWVANNSLVRYDRRATESETNADAFRQMLTAACAERVVPDCEFFLNRRDFPLLKRDATEPYDHVFDGAAHPLLSHEYARYAPIFSCSSRRDAYADILMPSYADWTAAAENVDDASSSSVWHEKIAKCAFRGTTTGSGTTAATNQRLRAFDIATSSARGRAALDFGFTKWNLRPRKVAGCSFLQTIERADYPTVERVSPATLARRFKYSLTLEGHVAAFRLSRELRSGSVVLLAASDWHLWYYPLMRAWTHYVPIAADLSDLLDKIDWCRANDERCHRMTIEAARFARHYLSRDAIVDYWQRLLVDNFVVDNVSPSSSLVNDDERDEAPFVDADREYAFALRLRDGRRPRRSIDSLRAARSAFGAVVATTKKRSPTRALRVENDIETRRRVYVDATMAKRVAVIGTRAINSIVMRAVPNFVFTFGRCGSNEPNVVAFERFDVCKTLREWIVDERPSKDDIVDATCQIVCALETAQASCGFTHNDLTVDNVLVVALDRPAVICYARNDGSFVRTRTRRLFVIDDYRFARAVFASQRRGASGVVQLSAIVSRPSRVVDVVTLLASIHRVVVAAVDRDDDDAKWIVDLLVELCGNDDGVALTRDDYYASTGSVLRAICADRLRCDDADPTRAADALLRHRPSFERIAARDYVFCMDGEYGAGDFRTLMLTGDERTTLRSAVRRVVESATPMQQWWSDGGGSAVLRRYAARKWKRMTRRLERRLKAFGVYGGVDLNRIASSFDDAEGCSDGPSLEPVAIDDATRKRRHVVDNGAFETFHFVSIAFELRALESSVTTANLFF